MSYRMLIIICPNLNHIYLLKFIFSQ